MLRAYIEWWRKRFILAMTVKFLSGLVIGFGLGVYFLPIIIADSPAAQSVLQAEEAKAEK